MRKIDKIPFLWVLQIRMFADIHKMSDVNVIENIRQVVL